MSLFMLPETGTVDQLEAWKIAAKEAIAIGEESTMAALLDKLVEVELDKDKNWIEVK